MSEERRDRILVLGSRPSSRAVDSFAWDELPNGLNVADYDKVVFDLVPFITDGGLATRVKDGTFRLPFRL